MKTHIPVYRRADVNVGSSYYLPAGSLAWHFRTCVNESLPCGFYTWLRDTRTDEEVRASFGNAELRKLFEDVRTPN